jgi:nicotinate-nucleotide pyrophosphorylase (carboxylating)
MNRGQSNFYNKLLSATFVQMNITNFLTEALDEDIKDGDHSSLSCIEINAVSSANLLAKQDGILAGLEIGLMVLKLVDTNFEVSTNYKDGDKVIKGDIVLSLTGKVHSILKAERLFLNIIQRMSGIATYTNGLVDKIKDTKTIILDTRKTTPNFRYFEKLAVKIGGGQNHRMGLYDMIMLKDNHIDYAGGIKNAIQKANEYKNAKKLDIKIEVECRSLAELDEILAIGKIDRIMLDNFSSQNMKIAVDKIAGTYQTEASGGINENNILEYAQTGVDFISIGALTHSYKSLDFSLKATKRK